MTDVDTTLKEQAILNRAFDSVLSALKIKLVDASGNQIVTFGASPFTTFVSTTVTLTLADTAYLLPTSEQSGRKVLIISNTSDTEIRFGDNSVTGSIGTPIPAGGTVTIDSESGLYAACGSSGKIITILECK